jgi:hypothetical protein
MSRKGRFLTHLPAIKLYEQAPIPVQRTPSIHHTNLPGAMNEKTMPIWSQSEGEDTDDLAPELLPYALNQYKRAWDAYVEAGCPFGESDHAMLLWFTFHQHTSEN